MSLNGECDVVMANDEILRVMSCELGAWVAGAFIIHESIRLDWHYFIFVISFIDQWFFQGHDMASYPFHTILLFLSIMKNRHDSLFTQLKRTLSSLHKSTYSTIKVISYHYPSSQAYRLHHLSFLYSV